MRHRSLTLHCLGQAQDIYPTQIAIESGGSALPETSVSCAVLRIQNSPVGETIGMSYGQMASNEACALQLYEMTRESALL